MIDLWLTAAVECLLFASTGLLSIVQCYRLLRSLRTEQAALAQARQALTPFLSVGGAPPDLSRLRRRTQIELLMQLSTSLQGDSRLKLQELARTLGHSQRAERQLRSRFWWIRLGGLRFFSALGQVPQDLERCLFDSHPLVRAEAIYLVSGEPTAARVDRVVRELFAPASPARFASQCVLLELAQLASPLLVSYLAQPPQADGLEVALRASCSVASPAMLPAALLYSRDSRPAVHQAAAQLLGSIGGAASVERLLEMLQEPGRAAAAQALGNLVHWQAGPRLAALLEDEDYQVRYQAALALRRLGPPGMLFLRQASQHSGQGAPIARLVLSQC